MAPRAGSEARRGGAPHRRGVAPAQGRTRQPRVARERQDQGRGRRRGAGDDRHRGFRGRPVAHALRPDHAFGAPAAPHVRAMASARRRRRHLGVQFPGGGVVLERLPRGDLRQRDGVEALAEDRAVRARRAAHLQPRARARVAAADLPAVHRCAAPNSPTRFVDDRRVALVSFTGSTQVGRQVAVRVAQRLGKSLLELGGNNAIIVDETANLDLAVPAHRVRRGRHGRPALHHDAPRVGARVARRGTRAPPGRRISRRCASAIRWTRRPSWAR